MANIIDYVRACDESFAVSAPNRVDSLVFSAIAYASIPEMVPTACSSEGVALSELRANGDPALLAHTANDEVATALLLSACTSSPRYSGVRMCWGASESSGTTEKQFSALSFVLPDGAGTFVAFRGTDDSLVGWKENLNMVFMDAVPSQESARAYLESVASQTDGPLWVGGHSKGGNLAMYATATCAPAVRDRIVRCFAHDAPGLLDTVLATPGGVKAEPLFDKTMPPESFIGLLFDAPKNERTIVRSEKKGLRQHDPFSWQVDGNDFVSARALSYDAYRNGKRMGAWLSSMPTADRERFIEVLYQLMTSSGHDSMSDLLNGLVSGSFSDLVQHVGALPPDDKAFFLSCIAELAATMLFGPAPTNPQTPAEKVDVVMDKVEDAAARLDDGLSKLDKYAGL